MKKILLINKLVILLNLLIGAYTYTTYYGFLGGGNAEFEKFLIIPILVGPIFIITFVINIIIKGKLKLSKSEIYFPMYSLAAMVLPLLLGDTIDYFTGIKLLPIFMMIGNISSIICIIMYVKIVIKRM